MLPRFLFGLLGLLRLLGLLARRGGLRLLLRLRGRFLRLLRRRLSPLLALLRLPGFVAFNRRVEFAARREVEKLVLRSLKGTDPSSASSDD